MRGLKICLWVGGVLCLLSVVGMFLPVSAFESIAKFFGVEPFDLPDSPLVEYMVRLMSATYVAVGVYLVILAWGPMKYGVMVPFTGVASVVLGAVCGITGMMVAMPNMWFLGDSISCLIFGVVVLVFWRRAKRSYRR